MATYEQSIKNIEQVIEGYNIKVIEKEEELKGKKTDKQRDKLLTQIENLKIKIGKKFLEIKELEAKIAERKRKEAEEEAQKVYMELLIAGLEKADLGSEDDLLKIIQDIERLEEERSKASKILGEHRSIIKAVVRALSDGWTQDENVYKRYRMKVFRDYLIKLQDNPEYSITVDKLVELVGVKVAMPLLKVDKTKLGKAIECGGLQTLDGGDFDEELWRSVRSRKEKEPSVVISKRTDEDELILVDPKMFNDDVDCLREKGIDGSIINPLKRAGINTIGDLCRQSGESLQAKPRIGIKRAIALIDAVSMF